MKKALIRIYCLELMIALHLGTVGDLWAARAATRLRKLSNKLSD